MSDRDARITAFLAAAGWARARRLPIVGDASTRRYERLLGADGRTAVLVDSESQPIERWLAVRDWLAGIGVRVPGVSAVAPEQRLLLIEDLGDRHLDEAVVDAASEARLYARALALLRAFRRPPPAFLPPLDPPTLLDQLELFLQQVTPELALAAADAFRRVWSALLPLACDAPAVFVHRDLHARNLMVLQGEELAVIDFQDAFAGPPAYDFVSLAHDVRREPGPAVVAMLREGLLAEASAGERAAFARAAAVLAAQRAMRIMAVFTRLAGTGGKPAYRALLPRVESRLAAALADPVLEPLAAWCARWWRRPVTAPS